MSTLLGIADEPATAPGFWDVHLGHVLLLAAWSLVVVGFWLRGVLRARTTREHVSSGRLPRSAWLWSAAAATVLSGAVHLVVTGEHFEESAWYGWFFLVLAAVQFGWALAVVVRPNAAALFAGGAASLLVAVLWLATRTIGIPAGPAAGEREAFGGLDITASAAELLVAAFVAAALIACYRARIGVNGSPGVIDAQPLVAGSPA